MSDKTHPMPGDQVSQQYDHVGHFDQDIQMDTFDLVRDVDSPTLIPPDYHIIFPTNPSPRPDPNEAGYDFILNVNVSFPYFFRLATQPCTPFGEEGKLSLGNRIVLKENHG